MITPLKLIFTSQSIHMQLIRVRGLGGYELAVLESHECHVNKGEKKLPRKLKIDI